MLIQTLEVQDLEDYILKQVPEPVDPAERGQWKRDRAKVMLIIKGSISPVQNILEAAGWSRFTEKDPKALYELIQRAIPKVSADATGDLVAEFGSINRKTFDSLMAYQTRIQYLKRRTKELNCGFDDKACLWFTIKGLREVYPQWYTFLERDMNKGTLTWESLMTEMYAEANKEKTAMALPSLAKNASGTSSPQNSSTSGHSRKLQSEQARRFCSTCNKSHWVGLPLCSFCKKHHPGGEAECFEKHPEKLDEYRRRNKRQGSGESPSNEAATNLNASQAAFTFNSGLIGISIESPTPRTAKPSQAVQDGLKNHTLTRDSIIEESGAFIIERLSDSPSNTATSIETNDKSTPTEEIQTHLPSPDPTQDLEESRGSSDITSPDSDDEEDDHLASELPIPPESDSIQAEPTVILPRPTRQGTERPPGYYQNLHRGKIKAGTLALLPPDVVSPIPRLEKLCMTIMKAENLANSHDRMPVPKSYRKARVSPDWKTKWKPAFDKQYKYLQDRHVWQLTDLPPEEKLLPGKWVLDEKMSPTGDWVGRARWVVCGNFEEEDSWAVQDVYAAVANTTSVKIFLLWTAILDLECFQFDIATAFLNADIPEGTNIYVMQPEGYEDGTSKVCLLRKALYGLRKSPLWWFKTITPILQSLGFEPLDADLCLFKDEERGCILILYVDDMLVAATTKETVFHVREQLQTFFELKDLGEVKDFLGFTVIRDRPNNRIYLSQKKFTEKIISKYGYQTYNAATTPWPRGFEIPATWEPDKTFQKSYIKQTGSLNFLSTGTRPDITYTTNRLCEANAGPSDQHKQLLKHLFRYLVGTTNLSLCLGGKCSISNLPLLAFADAAFADRIPTRHSTAGYTILLAGCPILWKSSRQTIVALSTTEAEFMNLTPAGQALLQRCFQFK
ncbi:hypothetical protein HIM_12383 [Hirsutella minnesotensis 3608]|uniref:Reverse transcriptase Ty1/copia-type domain-containing protein n=1 Tax=Hirsutella minnesotensis 3608 TaxID=1043627 RepID=A0A0F7ZEZ0_9HYPO|nr:hypothetical protein HIM_12383 [Hirsutella minnesotensis 3608]